MPLAGVAPRRARPLRTFFLLPALAALLPAPGSALAETPEAPPRAPPEAPEAKREAPPKPPGTPASAAAGAAAGTRVERAVSELAAWARGTGARLGALVVDIETGSVLGASGEHEPLNPASNAKVVTAAAVLDRLGPDFRFTTGLYGRIADGTAAPLVLRGNGDPSLETDELWQLASALYAQGLRRVEGIFVDQSHFDGSFVPPAFEQQPDEWAPFRAPVSAVALERNAVTLNVAPGAAGKPATLWFEPPGFVDVRGVVDTKPRVASQAVRLTLSPSGDRLRADVGGFIGDGAPRLRFSKRVDDPRLLPGYSLAEILRRMGVTVTGKVALGGRDVHARLAYVESAPLSILVRELGKNSDNFYAEMLFKTLGAETKGPPARAEAGAEAAVAWLKEIGAFEPGTVVKNGSGLFDANRLTASTLVTVLRRAYESPRLGPDYVTQFAVGGVDGTLKSRFRQLAATRSLRAKTGTLDRTVALSGYVLGGRGRPPIAFALIVDGTNRRPEARQRIDRTLEAIAGSAR